MSAEHPQGALLALGTLLASQCPLCRSVPSLLLTALAALAAAPSFTSGDIGDREWCISYGCDMCMCEIRYSCVWTEIDLNKLTHHKHQ